MRKLVIFCLCMLLAVSARAQETPQSQSLPPPSPAFHVTDFVLPRFVSLGADKVFVRTGPGQTYPVRWEYHAKGAPVEIILEFDTWRKIRDKDGVQGWVHSSLLSSKRTALLQSPTSLYREARTDSRLVAQVEAGALVHVKSCRQDWCKVAAQGYTGWCEKKFLWGVYATEIIE